MEAKRFKELKKEMRYTTEDIATYMGIEKYVVARTVKTFNRKQN